jgi:hypothetical protein
MAAAARPADFALAARTRLQPQQQGPAPVAAAAKKAPRFKTRDEVMLELQKKAVSVERFTGQWGKSIAPQTPSHILLLLWRKQFYGIDNWYRAVHQTNKDAIDLLTGRQDGRMSVEDFPYLREPPQFLFDNPATPTFPIVTRSMVPYIERHLLHKLDQTERLEKETDFAFVQRVFDKEMNDVKTIPDIMKDSWIVGVDEREQLDRLNPEDKQWNTGAWEAKQSRPFLVSMAHHVKHGKPLTQDEVDMIPDLGDLIQNGFADYLRRRYPDYKDVRQMLALVEQKKLITKPSIARPGQQPRKIVKAKRRQQPQPQPQQQQRQQGAAVAVPVRQPVAGGGVADRPPTKEILDEWRAMRDDKNKTFSIHTLVAQWQGRGLSSVLGNPFMRQQVDEQLSKPKNLKDLDDRADRLAYLYAGSDDNDAAQWLSALRDGYLLRRLQIEADQPASDRKTSVDAPQQPMAFSLGAPDDGRYTGRKVTPQLRKALDAVSDFLSEIWQQEEPPSEALDVSDVAGDAADANAGVSAEPIEDGSDDEDEDEKKAEQLVRDVKRDVADRSVLAELFRVLDDLSSLSTLPTGALNVQIGQSKRPKDGKVGKIQHLNLFYIAKLHGANWSRTKKSRVNGLDTAAAAVYDRLPNVDAKDAYADLLKAAMPFAEEVATESKHEPRFVVRGVKDENVRLLGGRFQLALASDAWQKLARAMRQDEDRILQEQVRYVKETKEIAERSGKTVRFPFGSKPVKPNNSQKSSKRHSGRPKPVSRPGRTIYVSR